MTTRSLTAAGKVFDISDFADPQLDGPTALQVDRTGRVTGHLAAWNTPHIGYRNKVTPPRSRADYRYFHQGVVATDSGDLPVGHLTLGTGHAGPGNAVKAAAHYDNTGSCVAVVRAGEDEHGIWLSGRLVPGVDEMRREELRRSGVSGDWREIDGNLELVAALAVNVPGFPLPRTEQLVASGEDHPTALVAAGIVMPRKGAITREEMDDMVMGAAIRAQELLQARAEITASAHGALQDIIEYQNSQEAAALVASAQAEVAEIRRAEVEREFLSLLAAGVPKTDDQKAAPLRRYWTQGEGLARWASSPKPYTTLVANLEQEITTGMTPEQIKGLAANYYHAVFGEWPGKHGDGKLAADASLVAAAEDAFAAGDFDLPDVEVEDGVTEPARTDGMVALLPAEAQSIAVPGGDPAEELHLTLAYIPEAEGIWNNAALRADFINTVEQVASGVEALQSGPLLGTVTGRAELNPGGENGHDPASVLLVEAMGLSDFRKLLLTALGNRVPPSDFDGFLPHITVGQGLDVGQLATGQPVTFDRVRVSLCGNHVDLPLGPATVVPEMQGDSEPGESLLGEISDNEMTAAGRRARTPQGAKMYGVNVGDEIGKLKDQAVKQVKDAVDGISKAADDVLGHHPAPKPDGGKPVPKGEGSGGKAGAAPKTTVVGKDKDPSKAAPKKSAPEPTKPKSESAGKAKTTSSDSAKPQTETPPGGREGVDGDSLKPPKPESPKAPQPPEAPEDKPGDGIGPKDGGTAGTAPVNVEVKSKVKPRMDVGAGTDHPMEEDESPETGAEGGKLVSFGDGVAVYDDGTQTDGSTWTRSPVKPGMDYDGKELLEDQSPDKGAEGGKLVSFGDGVAVYDDGTQTDGKKWTRTADPKSK